MTSLFFVSLGSFNSFRKGSRKGTEMQKVRPSAMGWHSSMPLRPQMWGRVRMSGMKQTP